MPQYKNTHSGAFDSKKQVITKNAKPSSSKIIFKKTETLRMCGDPRDSSFYFREKSITQLRPTLPIKICQRMSQIILNGPIKIEVHRPNPRRSCSQLIVADGSLSISSSRRIASAAPSSSSSSIAGRLSNKSAANSAFSLADKTIACCRISWTRVMTSNESRSWPKASGFLPNVKGEPRDRLARSVALHRSCQTVALALTTG